ncbi:hypothetical protein D3C75_1387980 [compost metagenome]
MLQQFVDLGYELVDGLHQQGPVALGQGAEGVFLERAATHFPRALAVFDDQA